jgi:translation elongation factor EF-Ts
MTIQDYLNDVVAKMGEKIEVRRFVRYVLGEGSDETESERDIEEG